ncbi:hypothetical protein HPB50_021096 [Hyalomma asiaticum]|uniref:Uncharacterized protein n=1 Tax=Hyalomma asiaticum TaxID=266040 RepID=A0ACB7TL96_HYAAI|nr:hypothetical protein HPB50_021096 [Hyalomma asiaticum]
MALSVFVSSAPPAKLLMIKESLKDPPTGEVLESSCAVALAKFNDTALLKTGRLNPPFPPFWQASPELNRHSITARLLKHFSLSPTLWIVILPLPPRPRQLNMFYMLVSLVPKSSAAQGPTPSARLLIALPFGTSTT